MGPAAEELWWAGRPSGVLVLRNECHRGFSVPARAHGLVQGFWLLSSLACITETVRPRKESGCIVSRAFLGELGS